MAEENFIDIKSLEEEDENSSKKENSKLKEIKKKIAENKKIIQKYKKQQNSELIFLVNAVASKSQNLNILNIWELTLYQFKNQLDQLIRNENYDINIQSILAGADSKKIKLVHWTEEQ